MSGEAASAAERDSAVPSKADGGGLPSKEDLLAKAANDLGSEPEKKEAAPAKKADTASILRDIKWLSPHMWAFYAIWFVSIIAVSFAVERFLGLRRSKILPADLAAGLRALASRKGEFDSAMPSGFASSTRPRWRWSCGPCWPRWAVPLPEIEQAMTEACEREATRLYTNVRVQNLAFNVAPMLGLAGTVHGMILCFYTTAHMRLGENKMDALATGIYAALICTLAGLIVAIPAGILAHYFEGRILKMFQKVEDLARLLVPHLERFEGRPRLPESGDKPSHGAKIIEMSQDDLDDDDVPLPAPKSPLPAPKPKKVEGRP